MKALRIPLILAVIAGAVWVGLHIEHHEEENPFKLLFMHLMPAQLIFGGQPVEIAVPEFLSFFTMDSSGTPTGRLALTNLQVFQVAAVLLVLLCFGGAAQHVRTGRGDPLSRLAAGFALYVRDDMVYPVMGKERGRMFLPFFLCIGFFILFQNLLGLVPQSATATASIFVTGALAMITFGAMLVCGMIAQGPLAFWKNLVPHGLPLALLPLMFLVELVGLVVKPFALMVRLFANMTGGHLIVLSLTGLILFFGAESAVAGYGSAPLAIAFAVFIMIIETFVAFLQAYIFTQLSIIFVNASVHPEH